MNRCSFREERIGIPDRLTNFMDFVGEKMTEEKIEKAIELMEEEDKENERSDPDSEDGEDDGGL